MNRKIDQLCILGGTGFVGHRLTQRLVREGKRVKILSRHPERHRDLSLLPGVTVAAANVHDPAALDREFRGIDAVVNLVGILNERRDGDFRRAHVELPRKVVRACIDRGVHRLLHMSALGADETNGTSRYLRSKGEGESVAHGVAPKEVAVTSFRPSVIFGPGDSFFNRFSVLLRWLPGPFPLAGAGARFKPVYVGDVVEAFARALENPAAYGQRYELCGPHEMTLRQLVEYTADTLELCRPVIPLPNAVARLQAALLEWVPGKPLTRDNLDSMRTPSVCTDDGLGRLGIVPTPMESVVPEYLADRGDRNRLNSLHRAMARRGAERPGG